MKSLCRSQQAQGLINQKLHVPSCVALHRDALESLGVTFFDPGHKKHKGTSDTHFGSSHAVTLSFIVAAIQNLILYSNCCCSCFHQIKKHAPNHDTEMGPQQDASGKSTPTCPQQKCSWSNCKIRLGFTLQLFCRLFVGCFPQRLPWYPAEPSLRPGHLTTCPCS